MSRKGARLARPAGKEGEKGLDLLDGDEPGLVDRAALRDDVRRTRAPSAGAVRRDGSRHRLRKRAGSSDGRPTWPGRTRAGLPVSRTSANRVRVSYTNG